MAKEKDKMQKSIDDLTEWQDNQYNPGHWIGGITPNNLLSPQKPKLLGWFLVIISILCFVGVGYLLKHYLDQGPQLQLIEHFYYIAQLALTGGFSLLLLFGGIMKIRKKPAGSRTI
jgi:hypothetical protein